MTTDRDHVTEAGAYLEPEWRLGDGLTVSFQRTLRIPDDGSNYFLPPGTSFDTSARKPSSGSGRWCSTPSAASTPDASLPCTP